MEKLRNGITIIVLAITIVIMIIIAGVVIGIKSKNDTIEEAKWASFLQEMTNITETVNLKIYNKVIKRETQGIAETLYTYKVVEEDKLPETLIEEEISYGGDPSNLFFVEEGDYNENNYTYVYDGIIGRVYRINGFKRNGKLVHSSCWAEKYYVESEKDEVVPEITNVNATTNSANIIAKDEGTGIIGYAVCPTSDTPSLDKFQRVESTFNLNVNYYPLEDDTTYYAFVRDKDNISKPYEFKTDKVPDMTEGSYTPTTWTNDTVNITLPLKEPFTTNYSNNGGVANIYNGEFSVSENINIEYWYSDGYNTGLANQMNIINIDKIPPTLNATLLDNSISIESIDNDSGVCGYSVSKEQTTNIIWEEFEATGIKEMSYPVKENGTYYIYVKDQADNTSSKEITVENMSPIAIVNDTYYIYTEEELKSECASSEEKLVKILVDISLKATLEITNNSNITIDLNGYKITSGLEYTIINNGTFILLDKSIDKTGCLENSFNIGVLNNGTFTLGEEDNIGLYPYIFAEKIGVNNDNVFNFYSGKIKSDKAIRGNTPNTPYAHNVIIEDEDQKQVATLVKIEDPEARFNGVYYSTLKEAIDKSQGELETITEPQDIMSKVQNNGTYYFEKNEKGELVSNNTNIANTTSNSYIEIDLEGMEGEYILSINASISCQNSNYDVGYATITNSNTAPAYNNTDGRFIFISGTVNTTDYVKTLEGGSRYYLHFGYMKNGSVNTGTDTFTIHNIMINGSKSFGKVNLIDKSQKEITVLKDITFTETQNIDGLKNINLDLNGHTINNSGNIYLFDNYGTLAFSDKSENNTGKLYNNVYRLIRNYGSLEFISGNFEMAVQESAILNIGDMIVNGGNFNLGATYSSIFYNLRKFRYK